MLEIGLYEQLINYIVATKLSSLDKEQYYIQETRIDENEASRILSQYLAERIQFVLNSIPTHDIEKKIELSNKILYILKDEIKNNDFKENLIEISGKILNAVFSKIDSKFSDFEKYLSEITPFTSLAQSELFIGSNLGISLESEIKKEILSADKIYFLVSFIKWTGIRVFYKELIDFTESGRKLNIITTTYLGATDHKAIEFLSKLNNTEIKISYNANNERLHAKAYLFLRKTGFNTGYIGSSNLSRSALTNGLEWNVKVTSKEVQHIIDKFQKTFETYWHDKEFEPFCFEKDTQRLLSSLKNEHPSSKADPVVYFDLKPYPFQQEILEKLDTERMVHSRYKNLIVAATGTGKTIISAFDYKRFKESKIVAKILYISHRKEILEQALATYRGILKDNNFGEIWGEGVKPDKYEFVFAMVQTLNNQMENIPLSSTYYDYIVVDEVHHIAASSYRPIINYFKPKILLGLTATPERMDNENILKDFCDTIGAEIRLPEAINRRLLCPFQYFGITDTIDISRVNWQNGRYVPSELSNLYTSNDRRVYDIINNLDKYLTDYRNVRALGFCITQEHAKFMAEKFTLAGLKSDYLVSNRNNLRDELRSKLQRKEINYLFVVDIFNEGVDIPEIDTILFLRPTESLTIFLQQLGRGLRLSNEKDCLTVLDFVGNSRPEYDYESKFRALIGKTNTSVIKNIENNFPQLPLGCSIELEKVAKEFIMDNIISATQSAKIQIINKLINYKFQTELPLTLTNFLNFYNIPIQLIYKYGGWCKLLKIAELIDDYSQENEREIIRAIINKWVPCTSVTYLSFILRLSKDNFNVQIEQLSEEQKKMCLMLYYDVWKIPGRHKSLEEGIIQIGKNKTIVNEIIEVIQYLLDKIDHIERSILLPYKQPLKVHSRYTRDQILCAFGFHTANKNSNIREGSAYKKEINTELLFVTLNKSEKKFSQTTMYNDFAMDDYLFFWQSQNSASPTTPKGLRYIKQKDNGLKVLLFVRERNEDEYGNTMTFVFLGECNIQSYSGEKPMNIIWHLEEPIPAYLHTVTNKMALG